MSARFENEHVRGRSGAPEQCVDGGCRPLGVKPAADAEPSAARRRAGRGDRFPNPTGHASQAVPGASPMNALLRAARVSAPSSAASLIVLLVAVGLTRLHLGRGRARAGAGPAGTGARAVHLAATRRGAPYRLGAVGPRRFDCSGLTMWVYARLGKRLPRTAAQQYAATRHIAASSPPTRRPGLLHDPVRLRPPRGHLRGRRADLARPAYRRPCAAGPDLDPAVRYGRVRRRDHPTHGARRWAGYCLPGRPAGSNAAARQAEVGGAPPRGPAPAAPGRHRT